MASFDQIINIILKYEQQNPQLMQQLTENIDANKAKILELASVYGKAQGDVINKSAQVQEAEKKLNIIIGEGAAILANKSAQQNTTIGQLLDLSARQAAAQQSLTAAQGQYNAALENSRTIAEQYKREYQAVIQSSTKNAEEQLALINKINNLTDASGKKQIDVGKTVNQEVEKYSAAIIERTIAEQDYLALLQKKLALEKEIVVHRKTLATLTDKTIETTSEGQIQRLKQTVDRIKELENGILSVDQKIITTGEDLKKFGGEASDAAKKVTDALAFKPQNAGLQASLDEQRKKYEELQTMSSKAASVAEVNQAKIAAASIKINTLLSQRIELEKVIKSNLEQQEAAERALAELKDKTDAKSIESSRLLVQFLEQFPKLNAVNAKELEGINLALERLNAERKKLTDGVSSQVAAEFEKNYNASLTRLIERTGLTTKEISKLWSTVYKQLSADASKVSTEGAIGGLRPETLRLLEQIKTKTEEAAAAKKKFDDQGTSASQRVTQEFDKYLQNLAKVKEALLGNLKAAESTGIEKKAGQIDKELRAQRALTEETYKAKKATIEAGETAEAFAKRKARAEEEYQQALLKSVDLQNRVKNVQSDTAFGSEQKGKRLAELAQEQERNNAVIQQREKLLNELNAIDTKELQSRADRSAKLLALEQQYQKDIERLDTTGSATRTEIVNKYNEQRQKIEEQFNNLRIQAVKERNQALVGAQAEEAALVQKYPEIFNNAAKAIIQLTVERNRKIKELDDKFKIDRLAAASQGTEKVEEVERKHAEEVLKINEDLATKKAKILEERNRLVSRGQQSPGQYLRDEFKAEFDSILRDATKLKADLATLFKSLLTSGVSGETRENDISRVINTIINASKNLGLVKENLLAAGNQAIKSSLNFEEFGKALKTAGTSISGFLTGETSLTALIGSLGQLVKAVPLVGQVMVAVGASVTVLVNQFQDLAKAAGEAAVKQTILTSSTGAGKEAIGGLALQYEKLGGTSLQALIAVDRLAETLGEAAKGSAKATEALAFFGINAVDQATGKVTSADVALAQFLQNFRNIEDQTLRTSLGIELFGVRSFKLISTIAQNGQTMEDFINIAERAGRVLNDQDEKILLKYRQSVGAIADTYAGLQVKMGTQLAPTLTQLNDAWLEFINNLDLDNSGLIESIKELAQELVNFLKGIYQVGQVAIPIISTALISFSNGLLVVTNSIKFLINSINAAYDAFAGTIQYLVGTKEEFETFKGGMYDTALAYQELGAESASLGSAIGELITVFTELVDIITLPLQGIPLIGAAVNAFSEDVFGVSLAQKFFTDVNEKNNSSIAEAAKKYRDLGEAVVSAQTKLELISDTVKKELEEITRATELQNIAIDTAYKNGLITQQDVAIKKAKIEEYLLKHKKELLQQELQAADDARKTEINKSTEITRLKGSLEKELTRLRKVARDEQGTAEAKDADRRIKIAEDTLKRLIKDEDELATAAGESGKKYTEIKKKLAQSELEFAKNTLAQRVAAEQKAAYDSEQAWKRYHDAQKAQRDIAAIEIGESEKDGVLKKEEAVKQRIALEQEASDKELAELEGRVAGAKAKAEVLKQIDDERQKYSEKAAKAREELENIDFKPATGNKNVEQLKKEIEEAERLSKSYERLGQSGDKGIQQIQAGFEQLQKESQKLEADFKKAGETAGDAFKGGFTKADGTFVPVQKEAGKSVKEIEKTIKESGERVVDNHINNQNRFGKINEEVTIKVTQLSKKAVGDVVDAQTKGSSESLKQANAYYKGVVKGGNDSTETLKQNEEKLSELRQRKAVEDKRREADLRRARIDGAIEELNTRVQIQQKERAAFEAYYAQKAAQSGNEIQLIRERTQFELASVNESISIKRQELELRRQLSGGRETQETIKLTQELKGLEADRFRINQTGYAQLANAIKAQNDALIQYRQAEFELQQEENKGRLSGAELAQQESQFKISALQQQIAFLQEEIALKQASGASTAELIQLETQLLNVRKQLVGAQNAQKAAQQQTAASTAALYSDLANLPAQASEYAKNITIENAQEASAEIEKLLRRNTGFYLAQIAGLQEYATQQAYKAIEAIQKGIARAREEANEKAAEEAAQRTQERAQFLLDLAREEARARADAYESFVENLKEIDNDETAELKQHAANVAKIERDKVKALEDLEEEFRREDIKKAREHYYELQQEAINNRQKILDIETNASNNRFNFLRETILKEGNLRKEQADLQKELNQAQIDLRKAREAADADKTNVDLANAANEAQQRVNEITQQLGLVSQQQNTLAEKRKLEESKTGELKKITEQFKKGEISKEEYDELVRQTDEKFELEKQYLDDRLEAIENGDAQALAELEKAYGEQRQALEDANKEKLDLIKVQNELEAQQRAEKDAEERSERERRRQEIIANAAQQLEDERIAHAERMGELKQQQAEVRAEYKNSLAEITANTREQLAEQGIAYDSFFQQLVEGYGDIQNAADEALLSTEDFINGADAAASQSILGKLREKLAQYGVSKDILDKITPEALGTGGDKASTSGGGGTGGGGSSIGGGRSGGGPSSGSGGSSGSGRGGNSVGGGSSSSGGNTDPNAPEFTVTPQGGNSSSAADREKARAKAAERAIKIVVNAVKVGNYTFQVGKDKLIELLSDGKINRAEFDAALGEIEDLTRDSNSGTPGSGGSPGTGSNTDAGGDSPSGTIPGGGSSTPTTVYVPSSASGDVAKIRDDVSAIRAALGAGGGGVTAQNTRGGGDSSVTATQRASSGGGGTAQEESDGRIQVGPNADATSDYVPPKDINPDTGKTKTPTAGIRVDAQGNPSQFFTDGDGKEISEEEYRDIFEKIKAEKAKEETSGGVVSYLQGKMADVFDEGTLDSYVNKLQEELQNGKISKETYEQALEVLDKRRAEIQKSNESVTDEEVARGRQDSVDVSQRTIDAGRNFVQGGENKKKKYDKIIADLKSGKLDKNAAGKELAALGVDNEFIYQITNAAENQQLAESGAFDESLKQRAGANKLFAKEKAAQLGLSEEDVAKKQEENKLKNLDLSSKSLSQSGLKKEDDIAFINNILDKVKSGGLTSTQAKAEVQKAYQDGKLSQGVDLTKINDALYYAGEAFRATQLDGALQVVYDEANAQGKGSDFFQGDSAASLDDAINAEQEQNGKFGTTGDAGATPGEPPPAPEPTDDDYINKVFDKFLSGEYDKSLAASALTAGANEGKIKDLKKYSAALEKLETLQQDKLSGAGSAGISAADAAVATETALDASAGLTQVEPPKPPIIEAGPPPAGSSGAEGISPAAEDLANRIKNKEFGSVDEAIAEYETLLKAGELSNPAAKALVDKELEKWMAEDAKAKSSGVPSGVKAALDQNLAAKSPQANANNARSEALKSKLLPGEKLNVAQVGKAGSDLKAAGDSKLGAAPKLGPATPLSATAVVSGLPNNMAEQVAEAMQKAGQQAAKAALNKVFEQVSNTAGAEVNA